MQPHQKKNIILWTVLLLPYIMAIPAIIWHFNVIKNAEGSSIIIINKADMTLSHYNYKGELLQKSSIATGKIPGDKKRMGDFKTPEGIFRIIDVEDASDWSHYLKDDTLGKVVGAYGPFFIRLDVPGQNGIGIHGTVDDSSIGKRASEGCIRMHNAELRQLVNKIGSAKVVVITPGLTDVAIDSFYNRR